MSINLNDESFDKVGGDLKIFNDGTAGVVENVKFSVKKKTPEDKPKSPEYKITFTDSKGGYTQSSFWFIEEATTYKTIEEQVMAQGKVLKHLVHAVYGKEYVFPSFDNSVQMLSGCMKLLKEAEATAGEFRVFANYGTTSSIKGYIQVRSWVPFIEKMSVPIAETRLTVGTLDQMVRLAADVPVVQQGKMDDWE